MKVPIVVVGVLEVAGGFFIGQRKYAPFVDGGKVEEGEEPAAALAREWKEELDLDIEVVGSPFFAERFGPEFGGPWFVTAYRVKLEGAIVVKLEAHKTIRLATLNELRALGPENLTPSMPSMIEALS
jgi:8-oxo-dGTP pyrophosphatase MutT (NUDIX family)